MASTPPTTPPAIGAALNFDPDDSPPPPALVAVALGGCLVDKAPASPAVAGVEVDGAVDARPVVDGGGGGGGAGPPVRRRVMTLTGGAVAGAPGCVDVR